ncbi:hypothetical protein Y032_0007g3354 [Ancylostoma ceylanicum]|uniref:Uncharacterized protein n=1 Tax=Ancylostoma ceylanicum TaxID=53326 RepID=A0A016VMP0_9BILA|nr:hypothetical protein Y032_0007g3354 [Ancylostoma ceylanicum]
MGVCMSQEEEIRQLTLNAPPNYAKTDKPDAPLAPEHTIYNYDSNKQDREKLAVLNCPHSVGFHPDRLAIVDLDENSENYCKVVSILSFPDVGDEPGRINWTRSARSLETMTETIDAEILRHYDISCPYAVHVLPLKGAPVHIATMGDKCGHGKGDFLLIDRNSFEIRERHNRTGFTGFGGDFSFQTRRNLLIASEWGHPRLFRNGFTRSEIENEVNFNIAGSVRHQSISPKTAPTNRADIEAAPVYPLNLSRSF